MNRAVGAGLLALATTVASHSVCAQVPSPLDARLFAESYFDKVQHGDAESMVEMAHHVLIERLGGIDVARRDMGEAVRQQHALGMSPTRIDIQRMTLLSSADRWVYLVEATQRLPGFPGTVDMPRLYVIGPARRVGRLEMLDLACLSVPWIEDMLPGFARSETARSLIARGLLQDPGLFPLSPSAAPAP